MTNLKNLKYLSITTTNPGGDDIRATNNTVEDLQIQSYLFYKKNTKIIRVGCKLHNHAIHTDKLNLTRFDCKSYVNLEIKPDRLGIGRIFLLTIAYLLAVSLPSAMILCTQSKRETL